MTSKQLHDFRNEGTIKVSGNFLELKINPKKQNVKIDTIIAPSTRKLSMNHIKTMGDGLTNEVNVGSNTKITHFNGSGRQHLNLLDQSDYNKEKRIADCNYQDSFDAKDDTERGDGVLYTKSSEYPGQFKSSYTIVSENDGELQVTFISNC